ncbi:MAG TPA: hypothetical protein PKY01_05265 [Candidatus Hydrogenedentes bacterium]|nr:hypothetical protein [Candidatus Hydrogenedentota bacterium]HQH51812.1 hypothetical protein [Candidatus Hydrogenedentota bacterium]HQM48399.1 hypothetical protein [Candidatus Hydrogenedentota bacterium]
MAGAVFHHFGVPTAKRAEKEEYLEGAKVYITNAAEHPFHIEFLRFEKDSPMHPAVQNNCHIAFMVDNLDEAIKGRNVIVAPFDATESLRVAFITDGDAVLELMEAR